MAGILLIAWIPLAVGRYKANQLRERLAKRRQLLSLLSEMSRSLRLTRRPPDVILSEAARFCDCSLLIGSELPTCETVAAHIEDPALESRVAALFHTLRSADATGADEAMKETIAWLSDVVAETEASYDRKAPLFTKLGALFSLFVFILLL